MAKSRCYIPGSLYMFAKPKGKGKFVIEQITPGYKKYPITIPITRAEAKKYLKLVIPRGC